jgi:hypothetical protein
VSLGVRINIIFTTVVTIWSKSAELNNFTRQRTDKINIKIDPILASASVVVEKVMDTALLNISTTRRDSVVNKLGSLNKLIDESVAVHKSSNIKARHPHADIISQLANILTTHSELAREDAEIAIERLVDFGRPKTLLLDSISMVTRFNMSCEKCPTTSLFIKHNTEYVKESPKYIRCPLCKDFSYCSCNVWYVIDDNAISRLDILDDGAEVAWAGRIGTLEINSRETKGILTLTPWTMPPSEYSYFLTRYEQVALGLPQKKLHVLRVSLMPGFASFRESTNARNTLVFSYKQLEYIFTNVNVLEILNNTDEDIGFGVLPGEMHELYIRPRGKTSFRVSPGTRLTLQQKIYSPTPFYYNPDLLTSIPGRPYHFYYRDSYVLYHNMGIAPPTGEYVPRGIRYPLFWKYYVINHRESVSERDLRPAGPCVWYSFEDLNERLSSISGALVNAISGVVLEFKLRIQ